MLMECINENLNSVIINQERIYCQLVEMMKKMDKLEKDQNVIIKTEPVKKLSVALPVWNHGEGFY